MAEPGTTVLVATDGTDAALGALRAARLQELRHGWRVRVIAVVEPLPLFDTGFGATLPEAQILERRRGSLRDRVAAQLREVRGSASAWDTTVMDGVPATRIVEQAREVEARTILMGLGRHGLMERFLGTETVLRTVRLAHRPILAVPADLDDLGHRLVAAVDFSAFSERAVRAALPLLKSPGEVHLVHVLSGLEGVSVGEDGWREEYRNDAEERLDRLRRHLDLPDGWSCRIRILDGSPGQEIPAYADEVEADLLAVGSHGHSFVGRLVLGSVSTRMVRTTQRPVLVAPPAEPASEVEGGPTEEERGWSAALRRFSERNRGRRTVLELDDPELGARHSGEGFLLQGVDYEQRTGRIVIVLGRGEGEEGHLTHTLPRPSSVEVVEEADGDVQVEALRIDLERGRVTLRIRPPGRDAGGEEA